MGTCAACSDHLMSQLEGEGGGVGKGVVGGKWVPVQRAVTIL